MRFIKSSSKNKKIPDLRQKLPKLRVEIEYFIMITWIRKNFRHLFVFSYNVVKFSKHTSDTPSNLNFVFFNSLGCAKASGSLNHSKVTIKSTGPAVIDVFTNTFELAERVTKTKVRISNLKFRLVLNLNSFIFKILR